LHENQAKDPTVPQVNSDILRWARETAGLTLDEAVRRLGIGDLKAMPAVDRLRALEMGDTLPSRALLVRMAKQYRRPLVTFYLAEPPQRGSWGRDFRTPAADRSVRDEALLETLVRNVQARQGLLRSAMLEDDDEISPLPFIGSATTGTPVDQVVASIHTTLGLQLDDFRGTGNADDAFRLLRSHAEQAGVFVLVLGNLGSHHTDLGTDVFRGFALVDDYAPFVVVNPKDSPSARSFTLLHELAHLWLGEPGISGGNPFGPVEVLCNQVASSFLLPDNELSAFRWPDNEDVDAWKSAVTAFADVRKVSSTMVAYRLYRRKAIRRGTWLTLRDFFEHRWRESQKVRRQLQKDRDGGPSYSVLVRFGVGPGLVELAFRLMASGALTTTKVGRVLGVNPRNAHTLVPAR